VTSWLYTRGVDILWFTEEMRTIYIGWHFLMLIEWYTDCCSSSQVCDLFTIIRDVLADPEKPRPEDEGYPGRGIQQWVVFH
jgi:hypothetical protein